MHNVIIWVFGASCKLSRIIQGDNLVHADPVPVVQLWWVA